MPPRTSQSTPGARNKYFLYVAVVVIGASVLTAGSAPALADIFDIGTLGGQSSRATSVNNWGDVVGYATDFDGNNHAFIYNHPAGGAGGVMWDLGALFSGNNNAAYGINDSMQIAGNYSSTAGATSRAFQIDSWVMSDLGGLGGGWSSATGINASGWVVGSSDIGNSDSNAFLYKDATMTDLGTLANILSASSAAAAINDSGQVTGWSDTSGGSTHAFIYSSGVMSDLVPIGVGGVSAGTAINSSGQVVGRSSSTTDDYSHAALFSGGSVTDLGTLGGGIRSEALGINDSGQVVGWSATSAGSSRAFIYDNGVMQDLNAFLPADSDWTLFSALGISNTGWIVGYGTNPQGETHGFLMNLDAAPVPEPVSLASGAIGLACVGAYVRRRVRRQ
ncbi:MAG: HAF repeat-containing protein [Planctomycetota bacterium]|nr:HAF repeat-containing protein [Planctomycetota bacterium]